MNSLVFMIAYSALGASLFWQWYTWYRERKNWRIIVKSKQIFFARIVLFFGIMTIPLHPDDSAHDLIAVLGSFTLIPLLLLPVGLLSIPIEAVCRVVASIVKDAVALWQATKTAHG